MKSWRELAIPHQDVLEGTFLQSEFAADISAVRAGRATREYQDAAAFFERTFITEGMRLLLTQVARRLNGDGGEPVIQLQTAFGGGKTHTMLAVWHLATREGSLSALAGVPSLMDAAGILDVPRAKVAVLDGTAHAPGQPWKHGDVTIRTLWGELAWQLGGEAALAKLEQADATGTSPGKEALCELLTAHAPCVVLMDELVAYIRQFPDGAGLSGGTYDSNLSFVQALTEAVKLVPSAIVLAALPESEVEAGSSRGVGALKALERTFGRVQALWKPVATEEAFEIVRRRLFEPIRDTAARDAVCREFHRTYQDEGARMPSETHEARYLERLMAAYPIHPEVFDRLYEDWTTIDGFQRTRGVLKLMARVIHCLWKDNNQDAMILPGSLPLYDAGARNELMYHLPQGWEPVVEGDIDGDRSEARDLDTREARFGAVQAARWVARTLFLGSAPSSGVNHRGVRGLDRGRVLLGCVQPGQPSAAFADALGRLCDRLHYLNASGDKAQEATRFWFDTRANLRREMEDRRGRFEDKGAVRTRIEEALKKLTVDRGLFDRVHVFTAHSDIPDDADLRLVFLPPDKAYGKQDPSVAVGHVLEVCKNNGSRPRYNPNRLLFVAPDQQAVGRLRDCARTALAWSSIVEDIAAGRLNIDRLQETQARQEAAVADSVVPRAIRECYKWLLCPVMHAPTDREVEVEAYPMNTGQDSLMSELVRVCTENELIIGTWAAMHLRRSLADLYWKGATHEVPAKRVWEDMQKYLYMPRLKTRSVLDEVIRSGAASRDFFGIALGTDGTRYAGFQFGAPLPHVDETLLLIDPAYAKEVEAQYRPAPVEVEPVDGTGPVVVPPRTRGKTGNHVLIDGPVIGGPGADAPRATHFHGSVKVPAATARMRFVDLDAEILELLRQDPRAEIHVTVEIDVSFPDGSDPKLKSDVTANATSLGFVVKEWEY